MEAQTVFVGLTGGAVVQPVGARPVFSWKSQEPPVGVRGAVADCWKTNGTESMLNILIQTSSASATETATVSIGAYASQNILQLRYY